MMRFVFATALALVLCTAPAHADGATVSVTVEGVARPQGAVFIGLYRESAWDGGKADRGVQVPAQTGAVSARFENVPAGRYAVRVFHDVNGDGKLGRGAFGRPTEPVGFSRDAPIRFGPPAFAAAAFEVGGTNVVQVVHLR